MTITRLWFHEFRKTKNVVELPQLPDGRDLLDAFETHAQRCMSDSIVRQRSETYAAVTDTHRDGRVLTITFRSGRYGEDGEITGVKTGERKGNFTKDDATTVVTHGVLLVPVAGTSALAFTERSGGTGGMSHLIETFGEVFAGWTDGSHRMERRMVLQSDAWLQRAELMKVTGTVRKHRSDIATEGADEILGTLKHVVEPENGTKYFPARLREALVNRKIDRAKFLGFPENEQPDEIEITVGDGDQTKTFEIDDEKTPTLRLVLTRSGEAPFTAEKVREIALSEAEGIFRAYDVEWKSPK